MNKLKVYEYNQIKSLIKKLLNVYRTNDMTSHKSHKEYILNDIKNVFEANDMDSSEFISELDDIKISKKKTELLLEKLKADVEDFELPSKKEVDKLFKKVKKLNVPDLDQVDTKTTVFLAWNDLSANRKYFVFKNRDNEYEGMFGELSVNKIKGFCKICNQESHVSLFLNKSKTSGMGNYTKKGDYICHDSDVCNRNLEDINHLYDFIEHVK